MSQRVLLLLPFLIAALPGPHHARGSDVLDEPEQLIEKMRAEERRLLNLKVVGKVVDEIEVAPGQWQTVPPIIELTAWHDGMYDGPARIEVEREIHQRIPDPDGLEQYPEQCSSYVITYDGIQGKLIRLSSGTDTEPFRVREATIFPERPLLLAPLGSVDMGYGATFANAFYRDYEGNRTLSATLNHRLQISRNEPGKILLTISRATLDNRDVIHIQARNRYRVEENWWIDPARGYSMLRYRKVYPGEQGPQVAEYVIGELAQGAGVWYPKQAFYYYPVDAGEPRRRAHYTAREILLNDPKLDPSIYQSTIPAGYTVYDKSTGKTFISGPTTRQLETDLQKALDEALRLQGSNGRN